MNISIIVPVYKVEHFVERCITTIINQTYTVDVECIIVDDCSPDNSMEVVEKIIAHYNGPIQFQLLSHEYNRGLAAVRNTGMRAATGDYIIHIDSDDYCELNMLESMYLKALEENADIVIADYFIDHVNDNIEYVEQKCDVDNVSNIKKLLNGELGGYMWNKLIKREIIQEKHIHTVEGVDYGEDFLFSISLFFFAKKVVSIHQAFVHYYQYNPNSYCKNRTLKSFNDSINSSLLIESRIKEYGLIDLCYKELYSKILSTKISLLVFNEGCLRRKCNASLCIKRKYILSAMYVNVFWKICLLLASYNILWIYTPIKSILNMRNKILT